MTIFNETMLAGQCALVTGGTRGIGQAIAVALAEAGCDIAFTGRGSAESAAETIAAIEALGRKAVYYSCDVSDYAAAEATVTQVAKDFGRIDILVNNAGITRDMLLAQMSEADFEAVIDVNLKGAFHMMRHVSRQMMRKRTGRIVNISSVAGLMGNPGQVNYAAAKAGLIGMTKSAAKELAGRSITVNAIAPGLVETDMTAGMETGALADAVPLKRMAKPQEVAALVTYLCSPMAGYITGEVIRIDGGLAM